MATLSFDIRSNVTDNIPRGAAARINAEMAQAIAISTGIMRMLYYNAINKRTGRTASTIEQLVVGAGSSNVTGYVGSDDAIALILEFGSRPHIITPAVKKALFWPGLPHPIAFARHPGTIPYLPLTRTAPAAGAIAKGRLAQVFPRALG